MIYTIHIYVHIYIYIHLLKTTCETFVPGIVVYGCNPTWEPKARGSHAGGQPELHSKTLSQQTKNYCEIVLLPLPESSKQ
jgi:hypothetical protein